MKTFLSILGYSWAVLCLILIPATFIGNNGFAKMLTKFSFMKVNARYSGGELDRVLSKTDYKIEIYKPVFTALIGESSEGFVQIKWIASKELPPVINDTIDFDKNGVADFAVNIDTKTGKTELKAFDKNVIGLRISSKVKESWLIRVDLKNPKKEKMKKNE
jgi:hypothetical protein